MRRNPATVVILAGTVTEDLLNAVGGSMNVALVRPDDKEEGLEAAADALRRAARISSPYVLVAADPLAELAAAWEAMWQVGAAGARGAEPFELRAAEALSAWQANRFELPDYYLVAARKPARDESRPDFHLGPLRSVRPHRVAPVTAPEPAERAAAVLTTLASLRHGRWWPSLEDIVSTARAFYPGTLAESESAPPSSPS